ncbi:endolytic transglycosylase MltG [bacterium 210820-DFI.6.37]|nr:endolytic transglycosylase MltG [bacterium 210820-DFI.6.37]
MKEAKEHRKGTAKTIVIILAVIVVLLAGGLIFYVHGISAADPGNKNKVVVTVENGTSVLRILDQLDEEGLVRNKFCGKVLVKLSSLTDIKANTYVLSKDMTLTEIFDAMNTGDTKYISQSKVTIIEGATIPQAAEAIAKESGLSEKSILAKWSDEEYLKELIDQYWFLTEDILDPDLKYPLEGYLYPETYFLPEENLDIEKITASMLDKMDQELTPLQSDISSKLDMSVQEFLAFASVVERESLFEEDRPKIAGVFKNRLDQDMALQSDITVLYALGRTGVKVSVAETQVDSPYNTYKNKGLPIGPICAVPASTMKACVDYEPSDYLFFFATEEGKVLYSKTYEEHQKIVEENKWY